MECIVVFRTNAGFVGVMENEAGHTRVFANRDEAISASFDFPDAFLTQVVELDDL